jgi:hypothetical protein
MAALRHWPLAGSGAYIFEQVIGLNCLLHSFDQMGRCIRCKERWKPAEQNTGRTKIESRATLCLHGTCSFEA